MKKISLAIVFAVLLSLKAAAGVPNAPRAVGLRVGADVEASYQHTFGKNFLEVDAGMVGYRGGGVTGTFDFIVASPGDFNIYVGPGAQLGAWGFGEGDLTFCAALAAQVGAEYRFRKVPVNLSLDYRPTFNFVNLKGLWYCVDIGVRYRF